MLLLLCPAHIGDSLVPGVLLRYMNRDRVRGIPGELYCNKKDSVLPLMSNSTHNSMT